MDLNDLRYFALTVEHGGFSAAARHAHMTKSKLSRRVALLEDHLGVRLLQRSTRRLKLTEAGQAFYEHCAAVVVEAEAAREAVEQLRAEPSGLIRMSCQTVMAQFFVARLVTDFMRRHPKVKVELNATDRTINVIEERIDVAVRALATGPLDPGLVARRIGSGRLVLVASAEFAAKRAIPEEPETLGEFDTIGAIHEGPEQVWSLVSADGGEVRVPHRPRLLCSDFMVQYQAAIGGIGIALLPQRMVWARLNDGSLVRVAPRWATPESDIHIIFASRRGMLPSVRALVDYFVEAFPTALSEFTKAVG